MRGYLTEYETPYTMGEGKVFIPESCYVPFWNVWTDIRVKLYHLSLKKTALKEMLLCLLMILLVGNQSSEIK